MKLSEAIREGAKLRPQITNRFFGIIPGGGGVIGSCAQGAAYEAVTGRCLLSPEAHDHIGAEVQRLFPQTCSISAACPVCPSAANQKGPLGGVVAHLNDRHSWTREEIADFVESVEASALAATTSSAAQPENQK